MTRGLRIVGVLAMAFAVAHCGDSDVRVSTDGVIPAPGAFNGFLTAGGTISIEVGSIEAITFVCDGEEIQESFDPPERVEADGTFDVEFEDGGRDFRVRGTFRDQNTVDGSINDEDDECDSSFDATRDGTIPNPTTTPARTPTGGVSPATPTSTDTTTSVTPTGATPTGATQTPTPTSTGTTRVCPVAVEVVGNAGDDKVLDSGWTGLGHNATVVSDGKLTFSVACSGTERPCGVCDISGPIQNLEADQGDINSQRCLNDTSIACTNDSACGSSTCEFFFGAPLPLSAGGINTCVVNQVDGSVSGTANVESGAFASNINLRSRVYNPVTIVADTPCPKCTGDATPNDGNKSGTCVGGARDGLACDVNGVSPIPSFGSTSLDCPPSAGGIIANLAINLAGSSGTVTMTLDASSDTCGALPSKKCLCPYDQVGEPTLPSACIDDGGTEDADESLCLPISPGSNKGSCQNQPTVDQYCGPTETFRGCSSDDDCSAPGDTCKVVDRPCFLDNGVVGGKVTAVGKADPPDDNGVSNPTFATLFCIPPVTASAVNKAAGLPGLGRTELPLISKEILSLP